MVDRKVAGLKNKVNGAFFEDIINQAYNNLQSGQLDLYDAIAALYETASL